MWHSPFFSLVSIYTISLGCLGSMESEGSEDGQQRVGKLQKASQSTEQEKNAPLPY